MKTLIAVAAIALAVTAISCGGEDAAKTFTPATVSLQNMQRLSYISMVGSGAGLPSFGPGGGATGAASIPAIGSFIRHFGGLNGTGTGMLKHALLPANSAPTGGQSFYFDSFLHLWVATRWSDATFTNTFYIDHDKTRPAGHATLISKSGWGSYPQSYTGEFAFSTGSLNGAHGSYTCTQAGPLEGTMSYKSLFSDSSQVAGVSTWTAARAKWQSEWDGPNKSGWYKDTGTWNTDRSGTYSLKASDGSTAAWTFKQDGSGESHFEGNGPKLPADLTWTASGNFKAIFPDKTNEEWTWDDVWGLSDGKAGEAVALITAPLAAEAQKASADAKKDSATPDPGKKQPRL